MNPLERQLTAINDFTDGFKLFLKENPDIQDIFVKAWHNADNKTIRDIVDDYIIELEAQP